MAAFCVWADVESYKQAKTTIEKVGDDKLEKDIVAESMASRMTQSFRNKSIRGMQRLYSDVVEHPITGSTIYVSIYGINANDAKTALEIERINYATKVMDNRYQTMEKGRNSANKTADKASQNRADDFQKGYEKQEQEIEGELQQRGATKKGVQELKNGNGNPKKEKKSTSGTFSGDTNVEDDF